MSVNRPNKILTPGTPVEFSCGGTHYGDIYIVDCDGGGEFWGECTTYDIMTKACLYKHVPYYDVKEL